MPAELLLIRHAESTWNAARRWQGHADPPLSSRGRAQAGRLARALASHGIQVLVASDLRRAAETAAVVGRALGLAPLCDPRLRELDVGSWAGLTREEIARRDAAALCRFESGDSDARAGGAETRCELRRRVAACVEVLDRRFSGRRVALVAHLGVIQALSSGVVLANAEWCAVAADPRREADASRASAARSGPAAPGERPGEPAA